MVKEDGRVIGGCGSVGEGKKGPPVLGISDYR
jgi:hypothetical protein